MTREDLINQACSYIKETPYPNPNEFTRWFWKDNLSHAWCGAFIDYVVKHDLGCNWLDSCTKDKYVGGFGYVPSIKQWAKDNGYWSTKGQKGDLVIYDFTPETKDGAEHIGIVCDVNDTSVISVDGNTCNDKYSKDCVAKRVRNLKYVVGYVNLPYEMIKLKYKKGDEVIVSGNLYKSAFDNNPAGYVENKETIITRVVEDALHPYNTTGDLGWMDESSIKYDEPEYKELYEKELLKNKDLNLQLDKITADMEKIKEIAKNY